MSKRGKDGALWLASLIPNELLQLLVLSLAAPAKERQSRSKSAFGCAAGLSVDSLLLLLPLGQSGW